jgi:drug/metabolite transporter (DMT)-like permease
MSESPRINPLLGILVGIMAVSTAAIFINSALVYAPPLVIAAWRLIFATVILAPVAVSRQRSELATLGRRQLGLALLSGFFLALHFATWISSLAFTTVASSVVLVSTTPLWVALLSPFTLKERITKPVVVGMLLALAGGVIVGLSDVCSWSSASLVCPPVNEFLRGEAFIGDLLAVAGAIFGAGYLIIGRRLRPGISLLSYIFMVYGMAALVLVALVLISGLPAFGYPPAAYFWFFLLALIPQLLGHSTFNWALKYLSAAYVSITLLGEPIGSTILAYIILDQTPTPLKVFGAILILLGITIASRSQN